MIIHKTADFFRAFKKLPEDIQLHVNQQEIRFSQDPFDPRLHLKKLKGKTYYSLRVTSAYRVLLYFEGENSAIWFNVKHRKDVYR